MKRTVSLLAVLICFCNAISGQTFVINAKGTRIRADSSIWALSGANIYNKNTGNVGIGITAPASILDIQQTTTGASIMQLRNLSNNAGATALLSLGNDARAQQGVIFVNSSTNTSTAGVNSLNIQNKTAAPIALYTNNLERVRIDGTGRTGFGTTGPGNIVEINSAVANTSGLTLTQLTSTGAQPLGVSTTGVVGVYNPANKQFVTQTNAGVTLTTPTTYPGANEITDTTTLTSKWTTFSNTVKALVVNSTTSIVYFTITGGVTFNITAIPATGTTTNELAIGFFVDNILRSVKNITGIAVETGPADFTVTSTGSVTGLSAGSHTFQIAILPRVRNNTSNWYLFSNAAAIGGFAEFPNRATTTYQVVDQ